MIAWTPRFLLSLAFLALLGTAATTAAWFTEARRVRMDALTAWTFLTPVFGIVLSFALLDERPRGWTAAGLLVVLLALYLSLRTSPRAAIPAPADGPLPVRSSPGTGHA